MTKTNSTADYFANYFRFKLLNGRFVLLLSSMFSVLAFFQYSVVILIRALMINNHSRLNIAALQISGFALIFMLLAMLFVTVYEAFTSFNFCLNKHETDMFGSLPITHRQRFWGDFISGYLLSVAPFAVLSGLSIAIMAIAESFMETTAYTGYYACFVVTVIFVISMIYALGVFAASISGRLVSAIACFVLTVTASIVLLPGIGTFLTTSIVGMPYEETNIKLRNLTPSIAVLDGDFDVLQFLDNSPIYVMSSMDSAQESGSEQSTIESTDEGYRKSVNESAVAQMPNAIVWTLEIAALAAAAFYLTKYRKAERTGGAFGYKYCYYAVLLGFVIVCEALVSLGFTSIIFNGIEFVHFIIWAAVLSAVVFAIFEISMRRGWKNFGIGAAVLAGSLAVTLGFMGIFKVTGGFGQQNKLPAAEDIVSAECGSYKFDDKEDIAKLRQLHSDFLKQYGDNVYTGGYSIKYTLKNGDVFERKYSVKYNNNYKECQNAPYSMPYSLKGFAAQLSEIFKDKKIENNEVQLKGAFGGLVIKTEKINEFAEILSSEYSKSSKSKRVGMATFYFEKEDREEYNVFSLEIFEDCTKTIEFLNSAENIILPEDYEEVSCYNISMGDNRFGYVISIRRKDLDNAKVKELLSLTVEVDDYTNANIRISCNDGFTHLDVPDENLAKFSRLAIELIEEKALSEMAESES